MMTEDDRKGIASIAGMAAFIVALAWFTHASCGCYGPDRLPPCSAPGAGCDYPAAARDAGP